MSSGNMKTCANCGNEVREGARFCASCGAPVALADQKPSPAEPQPIASSTRKRRLVWVAAAAAVALLVAGGAAAAFLITGGDDSTPAGLDSITNTTDVSPTNDATTTSADDAIGQGVDATCEDLVSFLALAKEADIGRGGDSVSDVEQLAAAASELASNAPADSRGEPRDSFAAIADAYGTYLSVLSELGLEPGPDALLEPRISEAFEDVSLQIGLGVAPWAEEHCSQEVLDQVAQLGASG